MKLVFLYVLWSLMANGQWSAEMFAFQSMETCQDARAKYIDETPSNPNLWQITRCRAKEVQ